MTTWVGVAISVATFLLGLAVGAIAGRDADMAEESQELRLLAQGLEEKDERLRRVGVRAVASHVATAVNEDGSISQSFDVHRRLNVPRPGDVVAIVPFDVLRPYDHNERWCEVIVPPVRGGRPFRCPGVIDDDGICDHERYHPKSV